MSFQYTVLHASDLHEDDRPVFAHAAAIASELGASLVSVHASDGLPSQEALHPGDVSGSWAGDCELEFKVVERIVCEDPVVTLIDEINKIRPNLIVVGTHAREGLSLLLKGSVSAAVVANAEVPVLVVPIHGGWLVDMETGLLGIRRILIPVENDEVSDRGVVATYQLMERLGVDDLDVYLLHVGEGDALDSVLVPERRGWRTHRLQREGGLEQTIAEACERHGIDLLVMPSRGADSLRDVLFGTNTERTIRKAARPVLTLPIR